MKNYSEWDDRRVPLKKKCFLCGEKLYYPRVVWIGEGSIHLHVTCAIKLGKKLIKDANGN